MRRIHPLPQTQRPLRSWRGRVYSAYRMGVNSPIFEKTLNVTWCIFVTGSVWNQLPERFGKWNSVYRFHLRWAKRGIFAGLLERTAAASEEFEPDEFKTLDANHLKVHQDVCRYLGEPADRGLGKTNVRGALPKHPYRVFS